MNIQDLRSQIDDLDLRLLDLLAERGRLVREIGAVSPSELARFVDPKREQEILDQLIAANPGPLSAEDITIIFREIFRCSLNLKIAHTKLLALRSRHPDDTVVRVRGVEIGGPRPAVIAGPCSVESEEQLRAVAQEIKRHGVRFLRGGAFKPRTSPYAFQGLGEQGLALLGRVAAEEGLASVSEVLDPRDVDMVARYVDIVQVGARNMANFPLLRELGRCARPVLLKRGMGATIEELLYAAEYVLAGGNAEVILCERGIRTFENLSRFTLDVTAIAILKRKSHLPVIADVSHSSGRRELVAPLARASLAAGADGVMVEVHPDPPRALSDQAQQLGFEQFRELMVQLEPFL